MLDFVAYTIADRIRYKIFDLLFSYLFQGAEDELKHAVGVVRPVSVAFEAVSGFRFYKEGVYTSDTCGRDPLVGLAPVEL